MITTKKHLFLTLLLFTSYFVHAQQNIKITGQVLDESREPLIGATVIDTNTRHGVVTDSNGNFVIVASPDAELSISYIGYATQNVPIKSRTRIEIKLEPEFTAFDELVVIGYGVQKRVNLTGAVSSVDYAKEAKSRPVTTTAQLMAGMNAGMNVRQASGMPGNEDVTMRIRGIGTLNNSSPLVIVDGFESSISSVNPDDIETVSILKDAASSAIYGNRGANGVVLITTKKGEKDKINISYNGMFAYQEPENVLGVISNYADYMEFMNESAENIEAASLPFSQSMIDLWLEKEKDPNGIADSGYPNYVAYPNVDWMRAMYEKNLYQRHNITANGLTDKTNYLISMSYTDNPGVIAQTAVERIQLRTNVSSKVTDWLEIGTRLWGYRSERELSNLGSASDYMSRAVPGIYPYYDGKYGWMENPEQSSTSRNNLYFIKRFDGASKIHYINATAFANIDLPFDIKYQVAYNYDWRNANQRQHGKLGDAWSFSRNEVAYSYNDPSILTMMITNTHNMSSTFQNSLSWAGSFDKKHDVSAMVGFESIYSHTESNASSKKGILTEMLWEFDTMTEMNNITGTQNDYASASVFGRANYAYDNRYLMEVNLRYDGSSRFARESRRGLFPSISAGWRVSQEAFMEDSGIDNLKLRASWGKLGNSFIDNYAYQATYSSTIYSFGNKLVNGTVSSLSNNLLEWETTTSANIGLELGILKNRLSFELDYYNKVTDGILYKAPIFATIGMKSPPFQNLCEVTNNGFEVTLGWKDRVKDFRYGVSVNFTRNYNEVTKYNGRLKAGWVTDENGVRTYQTNLGDVSTRGANTITMEGKLINEFYLLNTYNGDGSHFFQDGSVNPNGGPNDGMIRTESDMQWLQAMVSSGNMFLPNQTISSTGIWYGDYIYADVNGDGIYGNENDYSFQGTSATPKYYYGFQANFEWKGFDLSMSWAGAGGSSMYWYYLGLNSYATGPTWTIGKDIAYDHYFYNPNDPNDPRTNLTSKHGRLTYTSRASQSGGTVASNHWLYSTDYLKLKNITFGYTLPKKWINKLHLSNVRIFANGENLFTITDYPGLDPEFSDTMNYYAALRQYSIGININF